MIIEFVFDTPTEVYVDNGPDFKRFKFKYTLKYFSRENEISNELENKFIITTPNTLLTRWNYENNDQLFKGLYFKFILQLLKKKLCDGNLELVEKIQLSSVKDSEIKYHSNGNFINEVYRYDLDELCKDKNKVKMGFQISN